MTSTRSPIRYPGKSRRAGNRVCDSAALQRQPHPVRQSRARPRRPAGADRACRQRAAMPNYAREASQWGHGFQSLGLKRGDRILMFLDDTPAYPAAFFGAVRVRLRAAVDQYADAAGPAAVLSLGCRRGGRGRGCRILLALRCRGLQGHAAAHADRGQRRRGRTRRAEGACRGDMAARLSRPNCRKPTRTATRWRSGCIRRARPDGPRASCICSTTWPIARRRLPATC